MGKSTEPPKCKVCGNTHWGTCFQREAEPGMAFVKKAKIGSIIFEAGQGGEIGLSVQPSGAPPSDGWPTNHPDPIGGVFMGYAHPVKDTLEELLAADPKRKRGRPATGFHKREHDRLKAKERRLKLKEGK